MHVRPHLDITPVERPQRVPQCARARARAHRAVLALRQALLQLADGGERQVAHADVELDVVGDDAHVPHVVADLWEPAGNTTLDILVDRRPQEDQLPINQEQRRRRGRVLRRVALEQLRVGHEP